ncbi:hypothetical protein CL634_06805 [bacterium]|nr:hypothetical protein [bacterium]
MKFIAIAFLFLFSSAAYGDEQVTAVQEGDPAPFDGTCFNIEAAARILTELDNADEACQVKLNHQLGLQAAEYDLKITNLNASLERCNSVCEERIAIYQNQSLYFQEELKKQRGPAPAWTFVGGVIAGSVLTIATAYALSNVLEN